MLEKSNILESMLCEDLEANFLKELMRRIKTVYREAESRSYLDDEINPKLQPYCFGQNRYILAQSMFFNLGVELGGQVGVHTCESNGFPIFIVRFGRFFLTIHHCSKEDEDRVRKSSIVRQQSCHVNRELVQPGLYSSGINMNSLKNADNIYGNIIFGTRPGTTDFDQYGFVQVAVPFLTPVANNQGRKTLELQYAIKLDANDLLAMMADRDALLRTARPKLRVVLPKLKKTNEDK